MTKKLESVDSSFRLERGATIVWGNDGLPLRFLFFFLMNKKKGFSNKTKSLAAATLAQKIGYLKTGNFPPNFFENLPTQTFNAHKVIRPQDELFVIKEGVVEVWHSHHDILVTKLGVDSVFGDLSLLGQSMFGTQAISGGTKLGVMNLELLTERIRGNPITVLEEIGPRLIRAETEHYRTAFQTTDARLAAVLLELAGEASEVKGLGHEQLSQCLGVYRETVTTTVRSMKDKKLIRVGRKKIMILNKRALRELSEL
jgi:CRP-like cAMP-binding protein